MGTGDLGHLCQPLVEIQLVKLVQQVFREVDKGTLRGMG